MRKRKLEEVVTRGRERDKEIKKAVIIFSVCMFFSSYTHKSKKTRVKRKMRENTRKEQLTKEGKEGRVR